jgi:SpoIIAA-like
MPHEYSVDGNHRLVRVRMWGALTRAEIMETVAELSRDSRLERDFSELIDLRELTSVDSITTADVRAIAYASLDSVSRRAFVASNLLIFGLARMFASLRGLRPDSEEVSVFDSLEAAEAWLGVTPG